MKRKTKEILYWVAWVIGIIAALALLYGIIISLK